VLAWAMDQDLESVYPGSGWELGYQDLELEWACPDSESVYPAMVTATWLGSEWAPGLVPVLAQVWVLALARVSESALDSVGRSEVDCYCRRYHRRRLRRHRNRSRALRAQLHKLPQEISFFRYSQRLQSVC
jgi:hypothetical protein